MLKDLVWKASRIPALDKSVILAELWYNQLPGELKEQISPDKFKLNEIVNLLRLKKEHKNIAIITVIGVELESVLRSISHPNIAKEDMSSENFAYWFGELNRDDGPPLSVVVTMVGEAGNIPCAIASAHLLNNFNIDLIMLVGIAAGPRDKVSLGDVVFAEQVLDYEHMRLEMSLSTLYFNKLLYKIGLRELPRPRYFGVEKKLKIAFERYDKSSMRPLFGRLLTHVGKDSLPKSLSDPFAPKIHDGTIASGEKLFADGRLGRMRRSLDERIRAGDQEDSGFAQVAKINRIPWCIFRGICDYGDATKNSEWHQVAALAAASAGMTFLKNMWSFITRK